jgi:hypothetical protein
VHCWVRSDVHERVLSKVLGVTGVETVCVRCRMRGTVNRVVFMPCISE